MKRKSIVAGVLFLIILIGQGSMALAEDITVQRKLSQLEVYQQFKEKYKTSKDRDIALEAVGTEEKENELLVDEKIKIPDENLRNLLNEKFHQQIGMPISKLQLESIVQLNCEGKNIEDLTGIQYCINVKSLDFNNNNIKDITPLSELSSLEALFIKNNDISDLKPLSELINLKGLHVDGNKICDINPLINLNNLIVLSLGENNITDISPLEKINKLEYVSLGTQIVEFEKEVIKNGKVTIHNPFKNLNGNPIIPIDISKGGNYDKTSNTVIWREVSEKSQGEFKVEEKVVIGDLETLFKGVLHLPMGTDTKPLIKGAEDISIIEGTMFDFMDGVTAVDYEDGDLSSKIVVEGNVDRLKPGKYMLTYTVEDSDKNLNSVIRVINVLVNHSDDDKTQGEENKSEDGSDNVPDSELNNNLGADLQNKLENKDETIENVNNINSNMENGSVIKEGEDSSDEAGKKINNKEEDVKGGNPSKYIINIVALICLARGFGFILIDEK